MISSEAFMKKTLYLKFILASILFGFFGFMVVATCVPWSI